MARIVHKDGAKSCSFGGKTYVADAAGVFDVPDQAVPVLFESHRFVPAPAPEVKRRGAR